MALSEPNSEPIDTENGQIDDSATASSPKIDENHHTQGPQLLHPDPDPSNNHQLASGNDVRTIPTETQGETAPNKSVSAANHTTPGPPSISEKPTATPNIPGSHVACSEGETKVKFELSEPTEIVAPPIVVDLTDENFQTDFAQTTAECAADHMDLDQQSDDVGLNSSEGGLANPWDPYSLPILEGEENLWQINPEERAAETEDIMAEIAATIPHPKHETPAEFDLVDMQDLPDLNSEAEDAEAADKFRQHKKYYDERKKAGDVDTEDEIEYSRAVRAEKDRKRRRIRNAVTMPSPHSDENSMFFPEGGERSSSPTPEASDANLQASIRRATADKADASRNEKRAQPKVSRSRVSGGVQKPKPAKPRASRKRGQKPSRMNFDSLFQNNLIRAAQDNQAKEDQPRFNSTTKSKALSELISSMPAEQRKLHTTDKKELEIASKKFNGKGAMRADGAGGWRLKGMKSSLHHYQLLGAAFMRDRENRTQKPFGGFVSDEMGLGKTVMAIANIIDGRPKPNSRYKTTLVVAPSSLLRQWMSEIQKHAEVSKDWKVFLYSSGSGMKFNDTVAALKDMDIVVTSYHEVMNSLPRNNPPPQLFEADLMRTEAKEEWWIEECEKNKGPLHRVIWRRIIIDEAQAIKNYLSRTSEAVCQLKGKYRWAISGTPVQNRLEEFYAFFRFLDLPQTGSFETFKLNFAKKGSELSLGRLRHYLNEYMLRRTHSDSIFGRPILKLPNIKSETVTIEFNKIEKTVYRIIQERFIQNIMTFVSTGTAEKKYRTIFVLLLRLRQLTGHILLVQTVFKELLEESDLQKLWKLTEDEDKPENQGLIQGLKHTLSNATADTTQYSARANPVGPISFRFRKYLQSLHRDGKWPEVVEKSLCTACREPPTNPHITSCNHVYCFECLNQLSWNAAVEQDQQGPRCLSCNTHFDRTEPCSRDVLNAMSERSDSPVSVRSSFRNSTSTNVDNESTDWFNIGGEILQSAKTKATVLQIEKWVREDAGAKRAVSKIIIFTQMIRILERICIERGWKSVQFHGEMTLDGRDNAVTSFTNDPDCIIMLASLKAGGVGLNLTAASRVIIIDLWWNQSVETQAFCRVYRIGQNREVELVRLVVKDSIDEDIVAMQERKNEEIDQAVETKHRPDKLSVKELLRLFAIDLERDENGEPIAGPHETPFTVIKDPYHVEDYQGFHSDAD